jgi:hypothetical protein
MSHYIITQDTIELAALLVAAIVVKSYQSSKRLKLSYSISFRLYMMPNNIIAHSNFQRRRWINEPLQRGQKKSFTAKKQSKVFFCHCIICAGGLYMVTEPFQMQDIKYLW